MERPVGHGGERVVQAVHGRQKGAPDPVYPRDFAKDLAAQYSRDGLIELYGRFIQGHGMVDATMRRILWLALTRSCGSGLRVEPGVGFKHPETFEIGDGVFIGSQAFIQGRFDGRCQIGNHVWIGPRATSMPGTWCSETTWAGDRGPRCWDRPTRGCRWRCRSSRPTW